MSEITTKGELYGVNLNTISSDFIGFQFNGVHSSELNIVRTSDGNRYEESLVSNFQDKTAQVPGSDETLYWESFYSNRTWNVQIAFDNMSEVQFRRMRQTFNAKAVGYLVFDEMPFKAYYVKIQNPPQIKYLCFGETASNRTYKGEGVIQFVSYQPYARSVHKFLDEYDDEIYLNKPEWALASGLKETQGTYDADGLIVNLYNAGDVKTDWVGYYAVAVGVSDLTTIELKIDNVDIGFMGFSSIERQGSDTHFRVNSRTNLIEGCIYDSESMTYSLTGTLYNQFLIAGDFFKIPLGESQLVSNEICLDIDYSYLYY